MNRNQLVLDNLHIIGPIARSAHVASHKRYQLDDLEQEGSLALILAANEFDGRGSFAGFASVRIKWAICDAMRRWSHYRSACKHNVKMTETIDDQYPDTVPSSAPIELAIIYRRVPDCSKKDAKIWIDVKSGLGTKAVAEREGYTEGSLLHVQSRGRKAMMAAAGVAA